MIGSNLGSYEIRAEVGKGGMAIVYRAFQPTVDRNVAVKVITAAIADNADAVQRFQREARLIARLEHPHILPVYDFDGGNKPPYIVMRYLDGGTLKGILKQGAIPPAEISFLMGQVGPALDYAHRQGIIHRDVKPSNIMIDREGNAFVTDFGLARMVSGDDRGKQITQTGMIMGTPDYMSPEQAMGESDIDSRTDVYALGVIFYQMLTGQLPYQSETAMAALMQHMQDPIPSATKLNPNLPPAVDDVIALALAKTPTDRYASISDFVRAAVTALGETAGSNLAQLRQPTADSIILSRLKPDSPDESDTRTPSEQNKTVTALYIGAADLAEIIEEERGPEAARKAMAKLWEKTAPIIEGRSGMVVSHSDDTFLAVWGAETSREDDAEQAIRAALEIQDLTGREYETALQIGIHTGLALITPVDTPPFIPPVGGGERGRVKATGATISLTNRLMQTAYENILISHHSYSQVRGVFDVVADTPLKLSRNRGNIPAYQVLAAKPRAFRLHTRGVEGVETQMIGRAAELSTLQNAFLEAVEEEETQFISIIGEAGLGKSRLLYEFNAWAELRPEHFWQLNGRATPEMLHRPYALLRDLISFRFDIHDSDSHAIVREKLEVGIAEQIGPNQETAHLLGHLAGFDLSDSPFIKNLLGDPQQLSGLARQKFKAWLAQLCAKQTIVMQLEDLHHSDEPSLDLFTEFISSADELPLLMIGLARPTLLERRPNWGSGLPYHTRLDLNPLDRRESRGLAREILQKVENIPKALRDLLVMRAEGNPYYLEELVKMFIDNRVIIRESNDVWRVQTERLDRVQVPPTLVGLLQARLDSLLYPEKLTLQRAAVIGRIFHNSALAALDNADETHLSDLPAILQSLIEQEFIFPREISAFADSKEYIFGDQMLREVLLTTLLRRQQESYNRAAAEWLVKISGERVNEYNGLIADYYEKAGENEQAAHYLQQAGEHALITNAYAEARTLFERALNLASQSDNLEFVVPLRLKLGEALLWLGEPSAATEAFETVLAISRQQDDIKHMATALAGLGILQNGKGNRLQAQSYFEESLSLARAVQYNTQVAHTLLFLSNVYRHSGDYEAARIAGEEALAVAQQSGIPVAESHAFRVLGVIASQQGNQDKAVHFYEEALDRAKQMGNRVDAASILNNLGMVAQRRGDYTQALSYYKQAVPLMRETGFPWGLALQLHSLAEAYIWLNDYRSARRNLHETLALARRIEALASVLIDVQLAGWLFARQGETERGLALIGLAWHHPAATAEIGKYVQTQLADLGLNPEDPAIVAQLEAGKELNLEKVVEELLSELADDSV